MPPRSSKTSARQSFEALEKRGVAPHIYESAAEAEATLREIEGAAR